MSYDSLLSGVLGAAIIAFLSFLYMRLSHALRLNNVRVSILNYIDKTGIPKLEQYVPDCRVAMEAIDKRQIRDEEGKRRFDMMPMLSSEFFKAIERNELYLTCYRADTFQTLFEIYNAIDFLKARMPLSVRQDFIDQMEAHFKEDGITG